MKTSLTFITKQELAPSTWEFIFAPDKPLQYLPGQYAHFWFPHLIDDPHGKQDRTFTLTSAPGEDNVRFLTRMAKPYGIYKQHLAQLEPGHTMFVDEPLGDVILPRSTSTPLLFVAQGLALASYAAILRDVSHRHVPQPITLAWARSPKDNSLAQMIPDDIPSLERLDIHYPERIRSQILEQHIDQSTLVYLSGSQQFVESLGTQLENSGTPRSRLIYDYYTGYPQL